MKRNPEAVQTGRNELVARLDRHPTVKARVERMLDLIENAGGDLKRADEAERRVIEELRSMGQELLYGWVSRNAAGDKSPRFDKQHDTPGPAVIALALQRNVNDREQRIVVVGSGAFLANSFADNVDMGVNMVNWLASEERLITLQPRVAKDSNLALGKAQLTVIGIGFLVGLPLLLSVVGGLMWWRRRRA